MSVQTVTSPAPAKLRLFVPGTPAPQGSKTRTRWSMRDSNAESLHPWRDRVCADVANALPPDWTPFTGPVGVVLTFTLRKPASAPKRRRTWPIGSRSGDVDKLSRAVLDAITDAGWWRDDAQVVLLIAMKDYGERTGVEISISTVSTGADATPAADLKPWETLL